DRAAGHSREAADRGLRRRRKVPWRHGATHHGEVTGRRPAQGLDPGAAAAPRRRGTARRRTRPTRTDSCRRPALRFAARRDGSAGRRGRSGAAGRWRVGLARPAGRSLAMTSNGEHLLGRIRDGLAAEENRDETLNLTASQNVLSPAARAALASTLGQRSHIGGRHVDQIERAMLDAVHTLYGTRNVEYRLMSG